MFQSISLAQRMISIKFGLGIGSDDYITKPISPAVIVTKVKAHIRWNRVLPKGKVSLESFVSKNEVLEFTGLVINLDRAVVKVNGSVVKLSVKGYQLLCLMARHPERVYSIGTIIWTNLE